MNIKNSIFIIMALFNALWCNETLAASKTRARAIMKGLDSRNRKEKNRLTKSRATIEHEKARCRLFGQSKSIVPFLTNCTLAKQTNDELVSRLTVPSLGALVLDYINGDQIQVLNVSRDMLDYYGVIPWHPKGFGVTDMAWSSHREGDGSRNTIIALTMHIRRKADRGLLDTHKKGILYNISDSQQDFPARAVSAFSYREEDIPLPHISEETAPALFGKYIPEFGARVLHNDADPGGGLQVLIYQPDPIAQHLLCEMRKVKRQQ